MRRLLFSFLGVGFIVSLAGCHITQSHGVCDCDVDNHCYTRSPWLRQTPPTMESEPIESPAKLPEGKKKDL